MIVAAAILNNLETNRFHPIIYRDSPLPGGENNLRRLKSQGHHTIGFDTLEEAKEHLTRDDFVGAVIETETLLPWDGVDMPISVAFLQESKLIWL